MTNATDTRVDISVFELQRAIAEATAAYLARHCPNLPELGWTLRDDRLDGVAHVDGDAAVAQAQAWAQTLGLAEDAGAFAGSRSWSGSVRTRDTELHVTVWCVTDRDVWEADR